MRRRRTKALRHLLLPTLLAAALAACNSGSGEVREWRKEDHDPPNTSAGQGRKEPARPIASSETDPSLIELAWQRNCATCHGSAGRGDGPQGPMVQAPDLTDAAWQTRITDEQMATAIRKGKNKMPPFDLPQPVIDGLVKRIRSSRAR